MTNKTKEQKQAKELLIYFNEITFSDGNSIKIEKDEIIVFVGPNNSGKSASLKELEAALNCASTKIVIHNSEIIKHGSYDDFVKSIKAHSQVQTINFKTIYSGIGYNISEDSLKFYGTETSIGQNFGIVSKYFYSMVSTENRITLSNPAGSIALHIDPPNHPIHSLLADDNLCKEISNLFRKAFRQDLIPFRAGGGTFPLYVGEKPKKNKNEDELSKSYVDRLLDNASPLDKQGDGMRSFATILMYVIANKHNSIQFLDEPEAFLHPPQARLLGEFMAKERLSKSQLFVSTHSADILEGLIDGSKGNVRVVRLQREGSINRIKELSKTKTKEIINDTLVRYSGLLNGIFYQNVIICESDSDCLFYKAILNSSTVCGDAKPDVLFIHASGKHRMANMAKILIDLGVPVTIIADIDILNDEKTCKNIYESVGGNWDNIKDDWKNIKNSIESRKCPLTSLQISEEIRKNLVTKDTKTPFPKENINSIKSILKSLSLWDEIKRAGRNAIPSGEATKKYDTLCNEFQSKGIWIVPVGELEGFCKSVGNHGPGFAEWVLDNKDISTDLELEEARKFIKAIWDTIKK